MFSRKSRSRPPRREDRQCRASLIAGCGYVGAATADLFHQSGWEVQGWTSSEESAAKLAEKPYPVIAVDIANARQVGARPENFDAVIHCASTRGGDVDLYRRVYLDGARTFSIVSLERPSSLPVAPAFMRKRTGHG